MDFRMADAVVYGSLLAFWAVTLQYAGLRGGERRITRGPVTQRQRYAYVLLSQVVFVVAALQILCVGSLSQLWIALIGWLRLTGPLGVLFGLGLLLIAVSPLMSLLTVAYVYRRPVEIGYRSWRGKGYCLTAWRRSGRREYVQTPQLTTVDKV